MDYKIDLLKKRLWRKVIDLSHICELIKICIKMLIYKKKP